MKVTTQKSIAASAIILGGIAVLPGCSGPQEDVRITFCKNLTAKLLEPMDKLEWRESESQLKHPEYAKIKVQLETRDHAGKEMTLQASCFYKYDAVDDNAMTQSNPLSAYATVPYQVILNDQTLSGPTLTEAIQKVQLTMGKNAVEQVKKTVNESIQQVKKGLENMQDK